MNTIPVILVENDDDERDLRQKEIINSFVVFEYFENNYTWQFETINLTEDKKNRLIHVV